MGPKEGEEDKKLMCIWVLGPQIKEIMKKRGFFDFSVFSAIFFLKLFPFFTSNQSRYVSLMIR